MGGAGPPGSAGAAANSLLEWIQPLNGFDRAAGPPGAGRAGGMLGRAWHRLRWLGGAWDPPMALSLSPQARRCWPKRTTWPCPCTS